MIHLRRNLTLWEYDSQRKIADYNHHDFRDFWQDKCMQIVDSNESSVLKRMVEQQSGWFVDLGCGYGRLYPLYRGKDKKIVMTDYALNHLQMIEKEVTDENVYLIAADANRLPFIDSAFDHGMAIRLFHHMPKPEIFLRELNRITRSNSKFIMSYINNRNLIRIFRRWKDARKKAHYEDCSQIFNTHPRFFRSLLRSSDFKLNETRGSGLIYQLTHDSRFLRKTIESSSLFYRFMRNAGIFADRLLSLFELCHVNYCKLENIKDDDIKIPKETLSFPEILKCPSCGVSSLEISDTSAICNSCGKIYPKIGRILDFRI